MAMLRSKFAEEIASGNEQPPLLLIFCVRSVTTIVAPAVVAGWGCADRFKGSTKIDGRRVEGTTERDAAMVGRTNTVDGIERIEASVRTSHFELTRDLRDGVPD